MAYNTRSGRKAAVNRHLHISQLADSTSDFRKIDIDTLNVRYSGTSVPNTICPAYSIGSHVVIPRELYVSDMPATLIRYASTDSSLFSKLERKTKTFVSLISYILENKTLVRGTEESRTDALVNHILEKLEFGEYPFMIQRQLLYKFRVHTKDISSKYDFAVLKDIRILLIDEDKHIRNAGPGSAWGEYQIAGELIAGAYCNYSISSKRYNEVLYAVRVIGLRFTFYKAVIPVEYLNSLGEGIPTLSIRILRYPEDAYDKDFAYLDYGDVDERKKIIDMLVRIREEISRT